MRRPIFSLLAALLAALSGFAPASDYPQDYFRSPVDHAIQLAGTFGELRSNHFHAGIDIKSSKGRSGDPVYAAAEGHVYRIKVQSGGYGNALYIRHPNGYSTVYAHLHDMIGPIADYVKAEQYARQSFEVDLYPSDGQFPLRKGQRIGSMGNTGSSGGAHLHFEIRDAASDQPINPQLFGLARADKVPPKIHALRIDFLDEQMGRVGSRELRLREGKNGYEAVDGELSLPAWRIGLSLKAYDHAGRHLNGIYSVEMSVDSLPHYAFRLERFAFEDTRYINAHMDYATKQDEGSYYHRLYRLPGNQLDIYRHEAERGLVALYQDRPRDIALSVRDAAGNTSRLHLRVRRGPVPAPSRPSYHYHLPWQESSLIELGDLRAEFPAGALYEDLYLHLRPHAEGCGGQYSHAYALHDGRTPVHQAFRLGLRPKGLPEALRGKAFIAWCDEKGRIYNCGGTWAGDYLQSQVRRLGEFSIMVDTLPPSIEALDFKPDLSAAERLRFRIRDAQRTAEAAQGLRYEARIDGQWALMSYDAKNDLLEYHFDGRVGPGPHRLELSVRDDRDNVAVFEAEFSR